MAKAMKYRDVERALLANGCTWKQGKGDHIMWYCPSSCGKHVAVVTQARNVSPGVVADTITKIACLPAGWLQ
jgi:predicted RNA binding protein YcfA (HicA-like mRNA interferase family)